MRKLAVVILTCISIASVNASTLSNSSAVQVRSVGEQLKPVDASKLRDIKVKAQKAMTKYSAVAGFNLDLEVESLNWLIRYWVEDAKKAPQEIYEMLTCYLGELLISQYGGKWMLDKGNPVIALDSGVIVSPYDKIYELFLSGDVRALLQWVNTLHQ